MPHRSPGTATWRSSRSSSPRWKGRACTWARPTARACSTAPCPTHCRPMPADGAMRRLFIYYRVAAARADEAVAAAMRMQQALREREAGLKAELLRRPEITDSQVTLMETYAFETASVDE